VRGEGEAEGRTAKEGWRGRGMPAEEESEETRIGEGEGTLLRGGEEEEEEEEEEVEGRRDSVAFCCRGEGEEVVEATRC
jgi:hypothetical protein